MSAPSYLPGGWFAVVGPRAVVLLDESISPSRLQAVWDTGNREPTLDELIEVVTGGRFIGAPLFGIAVLDGARVRIVVRAGVTAVVGESIGRARSVIGGNANTWVEEILDEPQSIRLFRDTVPASGLSLPVTGGIVLADEVTWTPSTRFLPSSNGRSGSLAAVPDLLPAGSPVPSPADPAESEWSVWALDEAGELAGAVGEAEPLESTDLPARVTVDPGHGLPPLLPDAWPESPFDPPVEPEPQFQPAAELVEPETQYQPPVPPEPKFPALWPEAPYQQPPRPEPNFLPLPPEPSSPSSLDPESQYPPPLLPLEPETAFQPPLNLEAEPPFEPEVGDTVGYLHFSDGQVVPLDRPVIVGRAPSVDRAQRADHPRLIKIDNLDQDISRNHVEVRVEGMHVVAVDLNSANGTIVTIPGRVAQRLVPQQPFLMLPESVVTLSQDINFSYRAAE